MNTFCHIDIQHTHDQTVVIMGGVTQNGNRVNMIDDQKDCSVQIMLWASNGHA